MSAQHRGAAAAAGPDRRPESRAEGAAAAIKEARAIVGRLRCQPLLDRAADIAPAKSAVQDQVAAVPALEEPTGPARVTPAAAP